MRPATVVVGGTMRRRTRPAVDAALAPGLGVSRDGQPLSYNRAPAADLAPWIGRLYATVVEAPADYRLVCGLLNDTSAIRLQLRGQWEAATVEGRKTHCRSALYFGPHTRRMEVSVTGSFTSVGMFLRPGAGYAVMRTHAADYLDRLVPCDDLGLPGNAVLEALSGDGTPEDWLQTMEQFCRLVVERAGGEEPDPITTRFEAIAYSNPSVSIAEIARDCGISRRRLERTVHRDFGMSPKQVLRRARALDMASHLRGVADQNEAEELALRYYDQSHLIREFTDFFGMSPTQFVATPQPLMTLTLESRQARRLEATERLAPGAIRPWE